MIKFNRLFLLIATTAFFFTFCKKDDPPLPDNTLQFQAAEQGITPDATSATITLKLSRASDAAVTVSVGVAEDGAAYTTDYTTTPAASAGKISLAIPAGSTEASFTVNKTPGALFDGDESITFAIESATSPIVIGTTAQLKLSFSEILSSASALTVDGGGAFYPNKVFIDLSANRQTAVLRTSWDIGFATGDLFRVILNHSTTMMAKALDKYDLNLVTSADTVGFAAELNVNAFSADAMAYIDDPSGDITKTAIAEVSATDADNKVYIINRGADVATSSTVPAASRGWKKVRVLRSTTGGYKLQYADIDATTFTELEITKDAAYNFNYVHLDNGAIEVEPAKDRWDIAWTYFMNSTNFGTGPIPYAFQDMILLNGNGVESAKVLTSTTTYDAFAEADLSSVTFSASQNSIGSDWRVTSPSPATVSTDRFYIIKDAGGNYYKLRFTAITTNGERGKPAFEYALVKAGE